MDTLNQQLTIIIPAFNEATSIGDTINSLKRQTLLPKRIIIVDDFSNDNTGNIAKMLGAEVIRPQKNTGSKAGAQNFALPLVNTQLTMALDADTILAPNAIEKLLHAFNSKKVAAACGFVLPRYVRTIWERGRYIEYLLAFTFYKPIQDHLGKPLISSGCFSMYKTKYLREQNGWPERTVAEDMDLTWSFHKKGWIVRFIPDAICYPIEPHNFNFMGKQLKRWSHGFVQNLKIHWRDVLQIQYLNSIIAVSTWDAIMGALLYTLMLPALTLFYHNWIFLLGYVVDTPITFVPVFYKGLQRKEGVKVLISYPSFLVLRLVNSLFIMEAFWSEILMRKRFLTYEKGH